MDPLAERLVRTFGELVRTDSVSFEEGAIADDVEARMESLGLATWRDDADRTTPSQTGNLFGKLPGLPGMPAVAFLAHLDTVEPGRGIELVVDDGVIRSAGETILGADDKAAVAIILEALASIEEGRHPHGDVYAIFSVAEEKGLLGAKAMDLTGVSADHCFVLDSHGEVGLATVAAPWQNTIKAAIHGKAAHAGVNPEEGVNAIVAASRAIAKMRLGRLDDDTTANIGTVSGGRATNIIPDLVDITGEARSHDRAKLEAQTSAMVTALREAEAEGCRVDVEVIDEYHGFAFSRDDPTMRLFERACARIALTPRTMKSGGGSDANVLNDRGIPALVLSCGMEKVHSTEEYVRIDQLAKGHDLVLALVAEAMAD